VPIKVAYLEFIPELQIFFGTWASSGTIYNGSTPTVRSQRSHHSTALHAYS